MKLFLTFVMVFCFSLMNCGGSKDPVKDSDTLSSTFEVTANQTAKGQVIFKGQGENGTGRYEIPMTFDYSKVQLALTLAQAHNYQGDSNFVAFYAYNPETKDTTRLIYKTLFNVNGNVVTSQTFEFKEIPDKMVVRLLQYSGIIEVVAQEVAGSIE